MLGRLFARKFGTTNANGAAKVALRSDVQNHEDGHGVPKAEPPRRTARVFDPLSRQVNIRSDEEVDLPTREDGEWRGE